MLEKAVSPCTHIRIMIKCFSTSSSILFTIDIYFPTQCSMFHTVPLWISTLMSHSLTPKSFTEINKWWNSLTYLPLKAHFSEGYMVSDHYGTAEIVSFTLKSLHWSGICDDMYSSTSFISKQWLCLATVETASEFILSSPISKRCPSTEQIQITELNFKVLSFVWTCIKWISCTFLCL